MEINWSIAGWIIAILVLYTIGFYEGRSTGYKKRTREVEQEKLKTPPAPVKEDDPGILRIKNENGILTLDLDGTRVDPATASSDQRRRLMDLLLQVRPWVKEEAIPPSVMRTPPLSPQPARLDLPQGKPFDTQSANPTPQPIPPIQPVPTRTTTVAKEDRPNTPANSIVGQIDSILQAHISGTSLEERGVFIAQSLEGGVIVYVGLNKYKGVDEVPDEEIKSAIRSAIAEWEQKYTPGL